MVVKGAKHPVKQRNGEEMWQNQVTIPRTMLQVASSLLGWTIIIGWT
jgi:hypothetical protein